MKRRRKPAPLLSRFARLPTLPAFWWLGVLLALLLASPVWVHLPVLLFLAGAFGLLGDLLYGDGQRLQARSAVFLLFILAALLALLGLPMTRQDAAFGLFAVCATALGFARPLAFPGAYRSWI